MLAISMLIDKKANLLIKKIKTHMTQSNCFFFSFHPEKQVTDQLKVQAEPHMQAENLNKFELTPLKNSTAQNIESKTAKKVKLRCGNRVGTEVENKANEMQAKAKIKTQNSQGTIEKTFYKKQSQIFGKLKKNLLKPINYKSNRRLQQTMHSKNKASLNNSDLMPKSRESSVSLSQQKKTQNSMYSLREDRMKSSKSKKKIEFTVYQSRKKSQTKINDHDEVALPHKSDLMKHIESSYSLPYPYATNIIIDLFDRKSVNKLNASNVSSKGISLSRSKSRQRQRNDSLHKRLQKAPISLKNQELIQKTLQKLKKFQIVNDYSNRCELEILLKSFIFAGEPQCKWVLLVIDQVFKKIRNPASNDKI